MKKTILVTLVAALMLFAFTACDSQPSDSVQGVSYITIRQTADILEGQPFDAADFEVVLYDANGSAKGTVDGESIVTITTGTNWFEDHEVSAKLKTAGGIYSMNGVELTADLKASVKAVTSVSDLTGVEVVYSESSKKFVANFAEGYNRDSFTFNFNYNGGSVAMTGADLAELKLVVVDEDGDEVATPVDGTTYNVVLARYRFAGTENANAEQEVVRNIPTNLTVTYTESDDPVVESLVLGYYTGDDSTGWTAVTTIPEWYNEATTDFVVLAKYSDGSLKKLADKTTAPNTANSYSVLSGSIPSTLPSEDKAVTLKVVSNDNPSAPVASYVFSGKDWVASMSSADGTMPSTIKDTDTIQKSWFKVTATKGSAATVENFVDYEFLTTDIPESAAGDTFTVWMYYENEKGELVWASDSITVAART